MFHLIQPAVALAVLSAGCFLLVGLLTGVWKYLAITASPNARAPYYVDIAHRASLMYAACTLVLAALAFFSVWAACVNFMAVLANVLFFAFAILSYVLHGLLNDTNNQLRQPHQLGKRTLPSILMKAFMWALIVAEVGGTVVLIVGAAKVLVPLVLV